MIYRASLSHGTPPHIHSSQWDVLLPDIDSLLMGTVSTADSFPDAWMQGAKSFIALCGLTEILGDILALVYTLKPSREHNCLKSLRRLEAKMDEWEDNLDTWLRPGSLDFQKIAPGALNLQLSSLAVKMCISRIALQVIRPMTLSLALLVYYADSSLRKLFTETITMTGKLDATIFHNAERPPKQS